MKIKVSNNKELVEKIRAKIEANGGYCPCSLVKDDRHKCMCAEFIERKETGTCHCGLYIKEEN